MPTIILVTSYFNAALGYFSRGIAYENVGTEVLQLFEAILKVYVIKTHIA